LVEIQKTNKTNVNGWMDGHTRNMGGPLHVVPHMMR